MKNEEVDYELYEQDEDEEVEENYEEEDY